MNQNSHSLQRNNTHKHGTAGNGNRNPETSRSGKHVANKETGGGKVIKGGKTRGPGHHSGHNNHVSEVTQSLHVSGAPEVTGPRGHHSHDAHYFVDY